MLNQGGMDLGKVGIGHPPPSIPKNKIGKIKKKISLLIPINKYF
jgi:hypothetical protein